MKRAAEVSLPQISREECTYLLSVLGSGQSCAIEAACSHGTAHTGVPGICSLMSMIKRWHCELRKLVPWFRLHIEADPCQACGVPEMAQFCREGVDFSLRWI